MASPAALYQASRVRDEILSVYESILGQPLPSLYLIGLPHHFETCGKAGGFGDNFLTTITELIAQEMAGSIPGVTQAIPGRLPDIGPLDVDEQGCHRTAEAQLDAGRWLLEKLFPTP